jgi:hypothetical protein
MTDTSHITACWNLWLEHCNHCKMCSNSPTPESFCGIGINLHDEYQQAISSHPDLEEVEL